LLPNAGWLSSPVRPHQREVCSLSGGVLSPARLNPYPACYRPAFACSPFLYPLPSQVILRFPWLSGAQQSNGLTTFRRRNSRVV